MLAFLSFTTAVRNMAAAAQAAASAVLDFTVGSPYRAMLEANASLLMWLQWLILKVLALTRAATSNGADLDSWNADFSFVRLPAVAATGTATFSRFSATGYAYLLPGVLAKTADGTQTFVVGTDTTNGLWNAGTASYRLPASTYSVTVPVVAAVPGTAGDIQAHTLTLLATAVPGIDTVDNATGYTNGKNVEPDAMFRARFTLYIAGLRMATLAAFESAIVGVQLGLFSQLVENYDYTGAAAPGLVTIWIDDGSGATPAPVLAAVTAAVNAVRGAGIKIDVRQANVLNTDVVMTLTTSAGFSHAANVALVTIALTTNINSNPIGAAYAYTLPIGIAYDAPGVANVTSVTLNAGTADIAAVNGQVTRARTITVT